MRLLVVIGCALTVIAAGHAATQASLQSAGRELTGVKGLTVVCGGMSDPYGRGETVGEHVHLSHWVCDPLRHPRADDVYLAMRVEIAAHEDGHVLLGRNETKAECYGMAHYQQLGKLLGIKAFTAAQKGKLAFWHKRLPDGPNGYVGACVPAWWEQKR